MKIFRVCGLAFLSFTTTLSAFANMSVIYGEDNRLDLNEHPLMTFKQIGSAVAAQIESKKIVPSTESGFQTVLGQKLVNFGICEKERFSHQISAMRCSGFMVDKDLVVTSGQCVQNMDDCKLYSWIFDYKLQSTNDSSVKFKQDQVYTCKQIVARAYDPSTKEDYAVIRVDREIVGIKPLKFRRKDTIDNNAKLFTIGTSLGLPLKISDNGTVVSNQPEKYFVTNLDTYGGAAGAPVLNEETLEVEGIYISGEKDFIFNPELNCSQSKICDMNASNCIGERVTRITVLSQLSFMKRIKRRPR